MRISVPQVCSLFLGQNQSVFLKTPDFFPHSKNLIAPQTFAEASTVFALTGDRSKFDQGVMPINPSFSLDKISSDAFLSHCFLREGSNGDVLVGIFRAKDNPLMLMVCQGIRCFNTYYALIETSREALALSLLKPILGLRGTFNEESSCIYKIPIKKGESSEGLKVSDAQWFIDLVKHHFLLTSIFPANDGFYDYSRISDRSVLKYTMHEKAGQGSLVLID